MRAKGCLLVRLLAAGRIGRCRCAGSLLIDGGQLGSKSTPGATLEKSLDSLRNPGDFTTYLAPVHSSLRFTQSHVCPQPNHDRAGQGALTAAEACRLANTLAERAGKQRDDD